MSLFFSEIVLPPTLYLLNESYCNGFESPLFCIIVYHECICIHHYDIKGFVVFDILFADIQMWVSSSNLLYFDVEIEV